MKVPWQKERSTGGETAVQLRSGGRSRFGRLESYVPLLDGETALYREVREAVPVVDAAICKLIRLTGGVRVACGNERAEQGLQRFLCEVPVGRGQRGINAFLDCYLDSLLTCGRAVGEIVPDAEGREIAAVLCHRVEQLALREGETALDVRFCGYDAAGRLHELPRQELVLFTPLLPESLAAMRHVVNADPKKIFSFTLGDAGRRQLARVCEEYTAMQLERGFASLDYWKKVKD